MTLSILISVCNDDFGKNAGLWNTIQSIRETASYHPEIVVVDDLSSTPVSDQLAQKNGVKLLHNTRKLGVGPSRHIAALHASGDLLLIVDSHMVFSPGWYEEAMRRCEGRPRTLHCATCLGLSNDNMDIHHPDAVYHGATLNVAGTDPQNAARDQAMEVVWQHKIREDDAELPAIMGACYFMPRKWFLDLAPLAHLRAWGGDELAMSLAAWLSGGDVRLMANVRIGHKFRLKRERSPSEVRSWWPVMNKLWVIHTMLPEDLREKMQEKVLQADHADRGKCYALLDDLAHVIETDRARYRTLFRRDFRWYCQRFNIPIL